MNERHSSILQAVVEEYIAHREPVSSGFLARHFGNAWSPATMRNDLVDLAQEGYVRKMYYSSGTVPTAKAYAFFVDAVLDLVHAESQNAGSDPFETLEDAARFLSRRTGILSVFIDHDLNMALDGIEELFSQPDFSTQTEYVELARMIDSLEDRREALFEALLGAQPAIAVGEFRGMRVGDGQTSAFTRSVQTASGSPVVAILVGPARMDYQKNWGAFCMACNRLAKSAPRAA